jgi:hypothetical protein
VALEFTNQKNRVRGELIGLGRSGHPVLCPVRTMVCHLEHLCLHRTPPFTPLYGVFDPNLTQVTTSEVTKQLCLTCQTIGTTVGITTEDISICSLRSSGAMALLCADIDTETIRLLGRRRSNKIIQYPHVQALPIVIPPALLMVRHGFFSFIPNNRLLG